MTRRDFLLHSFTCGAGMLVAGCSEAAEPAPAAATPPGARKTLVVYYSWSGNTRALAKQLAVQLGCESVELSPEKPYPAEYTACTEYAKNEIRAGVRPAMKPFPDLSSYHTLLVGSPNWWSTVAPPVSAFLESPALTGKTVSLFITHGGGGMSRCETDARKQCKGIFKEPALAVSGVRAARYAKDEVRKWISALRETNVL